MESKSGLFQTPPVGVTYRYKGHVHNIKRIGELSDESTALSTWFSFFSWTNRKTLGLWYNEDDIYNVSDRLLEETEKMRDMMLPIGKKIKGLTGKDHHGHIGLIRKDVLKLSLPVLLEQVFIMSMGVINTIMAGRIGKEAVSAIGMAAAGERVFEFLAEEEEVPENPNPVKSEGVAGKVEFRDVRFGYDPSQVVIKNFSAIVRPGQKVAIVGPTGAGKTTIVKLLMRFYDVNEGAILVDGHDIRDFSRKDLRSIFGMVLQDTWLYNGSIMENIRYGNLDASDEEVIAAAKAAHVDSFVHTLPDGYHMILNEEASNVSQGQKQLITIARAILADPKILILDEATSSVDTRTEVQIQRAMDHLMKDRTSFIIAHRLSTIRDADMILVMNHGDIVEQGTHRELLAKGGFYAELYNSQFEGAAQAV
jgi:ABC-type multidrug transport system fused ATPase/permease subunit